MLHALIVFALFSATPNRTAPNVVLLSCDTLRPDHLGCYGYHENTSPAIDRLAKESLVFDDALCEVPLTNPSFVSMMTSRVPRMTGSVRNGLPLPPGIPTLAEQFHAAGYTTFCVQSNWTLKARLSGLNRGFDVYDDHFHTKRWGIIKSERYAPEVTRIALQLLAKRDRSRPFFAWIHYSDPHAPYRFHRDYNPAGKARWSSDLVTRVRARYDSEVAFMDAYAGRLLKALPQKNTYVIFLADHGESLYEHHFLGHGRKLYQSVIRIPLMIHGPGIKPGRSDVPARGLDIAPTILALAGLKPLPNAMGKDLIHSHISLSRVRVMEAYGGAVPRIPGARALMAGRPPLQQGVVKNGWKLILGRDQTELYNLRKDPGEERNLASEEPGKVKRLSALIHQWNQRIPRRRSHRATLTQDDLNALESLGYLK